MTGNKKLFRWDRGRQNTGYEKMFIGGAYWPLKFDVYILKFPEGSEIPVHRDEVNNGKHYRLNIIMKKAKEGGEFICADPIFNTNRIKLFRSDISEHQVTKITKGCRYVLSIVWVLSSS